VDWVQVALASVQRIELPVSIKYEKFTGQLNSSKILKMKSAP
jgi:hypothetical protein